MKLLITESTIVNFGDDRGGQHCPAAEIVDVTKQVAAQLVGSRRALYVNKADDPTKGALNTADKDMLAAAERMRADRERAVQTRAQK